MLMPHLQNAPQANKYVRLFIPWFPPFLKKYFCPERRMKEPSSQL